MEAKAQREEMQGCLQQHGLLLPSSTAMELHAHVELSDDRVGEYRVTEERPDGSLTLVPDTSFEAIRKRLGTEPATLAEFEAEFGPVQPPDGEG